MAPHHFPIHSNKLWFHVNNEITLISSKFSVTLYDQHTGCRLKLWPVVWPCTVHLQQRKRASLHWRHSSMTSFFIVVHFTYEMACLLPICGGFLGEFEPLNVVGHRADPKRHFLAWLRVIWVIVRENSTKDHFSRRVRGKNFGVLFYVFAQTYPYGRLAQILGYSFVSWT